MVRMAIDESVTFAACPTTIVHAPAETVWSLLTDLSGWGRFFDVRVGSVSPPGPARVGQRMVGESGPERLHLAVAFTFTAIDAARHALEMDIQLPLGITIHESLDCVPIDAIRCRVNYHCDFKFPRGVRGKMVRWLLGRELTAGPEDSLARLKQAAEQAHAHCVRRILELQI